VANSHKVCNKKENQKENSDKKIFDIKIIKNNNNNNKIIIIINNIYISIKPQLKGKEIKKKQ
jgi:hypothetical protein